MLTSVNRRGAVPVLAAPFVDLNQTAKDFVTGHASQLPQRLRMREYRLVLGLC